jgi:hypothetical protein
VPLQIDVENGGTGHFSRCKFNSLRSDLTVPVHKSVIDVPSPRTPLPEEPDSVWAKAKAHIRSQIPEIAFLNWFACTRELVRCGSKIEVGVPDELTSEFLKEEYHHVTRNALSELGIDEIRFVVFDPLLRPLNGDSDPAVWTDQRTGLVTI